MEKRHQRCRKHRGFGLGLFGTPGTPDLDDLDVLDVLDVLEFVLKRSVLGTPSEKNGIKWEKFPWWWWWGGQTNDNDKQNSNYVKLNINYANLNTKYGNKKFTLFCCEYKHFFWVPF